jgi:hypothetical protein
MPVTDVKEFTITRLVPPDVKIEGLSYPPSAKPGDSVTISWNACNRGGNTAYSQWTRLIDKDTGQELYRKDFKLEAGSCTPNNPTLTMPNRNWNLRIEAGYEATATAATQLTVSLPTPTWLPLAVSLTPIIFGLAVIGASKLKKTK